MRGESTRGMEAEARRLALVAERDGAEAACAFARATLGVYRKVLVGRGPVRVLTLYRRPLIESAVVLRRFLAGCPPGGPPAGRSGPRPSRARRRRPWVS